MRKILFVSLLFSAMWVQAQHMVTGKVMDGDLNEPVIGANVIEKGTSNGTITDLEGNYSIQTAPNAELIFSYVGMQTQEVPVNGRNVVNVTLTADLKSLDEVIVVGYGTARKRDLTGSIVSIKGDELITTPSASPVSALQGKVPGMNVINSGSAGSAPEINIRGVGSMGNAQPYYIVDGMFTDKIDFINPNDIENIEVLKDASSLAMFGVKGANGIIIVTTKKGKEGKVRFNIDSYTGFQTIMGGDKVKLADGNQFTGWYNELLNYSAADQGIEVTNPFTPQVAGKGTDWVDQITRTALVTSQSLTISSATEKSHSFFSMGYFKQDGVVKYDNYQRVTTRFNSDYSLNDWVTIGGNVALSYWNQNKNAFNTYGNILTDAVRAMPTYKPYNEDGTYMMPDRTVQAQINNPMAVANTGKGDDKSQEYRALGNVFADIRLFNKKLVYHFGGYGSVIVNQAKQYKEQFLYDANYNQPNSSLRRASNHYWTFQQDHTLTWDDQIGDHRFKVLAVLLLITKVKKDFGQPGILLI